MLLNVGRSVVLLWIIVGTRDNECGVNSDNGYDRANAIRRLAIFVFEWPSSILSLSNVRFVVDANHNDSPDVDSGYSVEWMKRQHGKNLSVAFASITWTFWAAMVLKIDLNSVSTVLYIVLVIAIYVYCVDAIWMKCRDCRRGIGSKNEAEMVEMGSEQETAGKDSAS